MEKFYKNKKEIQSIYGKVHKEEVYPHLEIRSPNVLHMVDLLRLPNDDGFGWCLTAIDCHSLLADAVPIKSDSKNPTMNLVINGLDKIYNSNINDLSTPICIQADNGFNNKMFKDWCDENKIKYRFSAPYQSRQQVYIERFNQILGRRLWKLQVDEEISTKKPNKEWIKNLKPMLELYNNTRKKLLDKDNFQKNPKRETQLVPNFDPKTPYILQHGTKVRVLLKEPQSYFGDKYTHKEFRATDFHWSVDTYTVISSYILPDRPPLYEIKNDKNGKVPNTLFNNNLLKVV
jgi:hypothetical protein